MNKVYILNKAAHDYSDARRFGELVFCTDGSLDKLDIQQMYREMSDAMTDSSPNDFILLTSLASLCSVACSVFVTMHSRLNLLIHTKDGYVEREVFFPQVYKGVNQNGKSIPRILGGSGS